MNIKELINRSYEAMQVKCSECKGVGCDLPEPHEECRDCPTCNGTGIKPVSISKKLMTIITDLCKALECWEKDYKCILDFRVLDRGILSREEYYEKYFLNRFESYLASVFIGLFDLCYIHKIEFKKDFDMLSGEIYEDFIVIIHNLTFCKSRENINEDINFLINKLTLLCNHHNIDIESHIQAKLEYLECVR